VEGDQAGGGSTLIAMLVSWSDLSEESARS
jgi:hypothetical protein